MADVAPGEECSSIKISTSGPTASADGLDSIVDHPYRPGIEYLVEVPHAAAILVECRRIYLYRIVPLGNGDPRRFGEICGPGQADEPLLVPAELDLAGVGSEGIIRLAAHQLVDQADPAPCP